MKPNTEEEHTDLEDDFEEELIDKTGYRHRKHAKLELWDTKLRIEAYEASRSDKGAALYYNTKKPAHVRDLNQPTFSNWRRAMGIDSKSVIQRREKIKLLGSNWHPKPGELVSLKRSLDFYVTKIELALVHVRKSLAGNPLAQEAMSDAMHDLEALRRQIGLEDFERSIPINDKPDEDIPFEPQEKEATFKSVWRGLENSDRPPLKATGHSDFTLCEVSTGCESCAIVRVKNQLTEARRK